MIEERFKTESDLISFIVNNNPSAVKAKLARVLVNRNVNNFSNSDVTRTIINYYNKGYDVSDLLDVPVINVAETFPELSGARGFENTQQGNLKFPQVLLQIGAALVGGSVLGNVLFPQETGAQQQPIPAPSNPETTVAGLSFFAKHKKKIIIGAFITVILVVMFFLFKKRK